MITAIQIYLIGKESIEKMNVNTNRRNQVENQKSIEEIYPIVRIVVIHIAIVRKKIKLESDPIVVIELKGQRNPKNTKEEIRND